MNSQRWPWWQWPRVFLYRWWMLTPHDRHVDRDWWKCYR